MKFSRIILGITKSGMRPELDKFMFDEVMGYFIGFGLWLVISGDLMG